MAINFDDIHGKNINKYVEEIRAYYLDAIRAVSAITYSLPLNANKEFYFRNHPEVSKKVDEILKKLYDNLYGSTVTGANTEWNLAVEKNNKLAEFIFGSKLSQLPKQYIDKYFTDNAGARRSFVSRKTNGLNLSDRVWRNTRQFKGELELALEVGIGEGKSAALIAKDVRKYLNEPDRLFRKVRDVNGELRLSKSAKAYSPGAGVNRSSYRNAVRLTSNETNFAYEASQKEKRQQQDFIVGIEIRVSPSHSSISDKGGISCDALAGRYPKDFDFTYKWHVNCICISLNILKTKEELDSDTDLIISGKEPLKTSVNLVDKHPKNFNNYVKENSEKWDNWKTKPKFFENNKTN